MQDGLTGKVYFNKRGVEGTMKAGVTIIRGLNHCFPKQRHPFNMRNDGQMTYAQWQYAMGERTIAFFLKRYRAEEMFCGKDVLDMGCGAAGKSLYYASLGAHRVVGTDIVAAYRDEAETLADKLGYRDRFTFVAGDAAALPLADASFDTIIMNDFMEHVSRPQESLHEALRLLRAGGRIYINFPPYYHPFGAHVSDVVNIPWVHLLFGEQTLAAAYRELVAGLPDADERIGLRISADEKGRDHFTYINHMTIKRFKSIVRGCGVRPAYYEEVPLRPCLAPLAWSPLREMFVRMVVCVLEKPETGLPCTVPFKLYSDKGQLAQERAAASGAEQEGSFAG